MYDTVHCSNYCDNSILGTLMEATVPPSLESPKYLYSRYVYIIFVHPIPRYCILGTRMTMYYVHQACRGGKFDYGVETESTDAPGEEPVSEDQMKQLMEKQVKIMKLMRTHYY